MVPCDLLADMTIVEPELVAAVVADCHSCWPESHHLNFVRVTTLTAVCVIPPMHRDQGRTHDGVWTVRTHRDCIGRFLLGFNRAPAWLAKNRPD